MKVKKWAAQSVLGSRVQVLLEFFLAEFICSNTILASMPEWSRFGKPRMPILYKSISVFTVEQQSAKDQWGLLVLCVSFLNKGTRIMVYSHWLSPRVEQGQELGLILCRNYSHWLSLGPESHWNTIVTHHLNQFQDLKNGYINHSSLSLFRSLFLFRCSVKGLLKTF